MPIEPCINLANYCMKRISQVRFQSECFQVLQETKLFENLAHKQLHYIERSASPIGIISRYLYGSCKEISEDLLRKIFLEITNNIQNSLFGSPSLDGISGTIENLSINQPEQWTEVELSSCGLSGSDGPTLEQCIAHYNTSWVKNERIFNVESGIQKLMVTKTGFYDITAYGAANIPTTASGMRVIYLHFYVRVSPVDELIKY